MEVWKDGFMGFLGRVARARLKPHVQKGSRDFWMYGFSRAFLVTLKSYDCKLWVIRYIV